MSRLKKQFRAAAKREVKDFDSWYEENKTAIVNKQIYASQTTPVVKKKRFRLAPLLSACATVAVICCIVFALDVFPTVRKIPVNDNKATTENPSGESSGQEVIIKEADFTADIKEIYDNLVDEMNFKAVIDDLTAEKTDGVLTNFKGQVSVNNVGSYSIDIKVDADESYNFDGKFSTETVQPVKIDSFNVWYKNETVEDYMLKLYNSDTHGTCFMTVRCGAGTQNGIDPFLEKLCRG